MNSYFEFQTPEREGSTSSAATPSEGFPTPGSTGVTPLMQGVKRKRDDDSDSEPEPEDDVK